MLDRPRLGLPAYAQAKGYGVDVSASNTACARADPMLTFFSVRVLALFTARSSPRSSTTARHGLVVHRFHRKNDVNSVQAVNVFAAFLVLLSGFVSGRPARPSSTHGCAADEPTHRRCWSVTEAVRRPPRRRRADPADPAPVVTNPSAIAGARAAGDDPAGVLGPYLTHWSYREPDYEAIRAAPSARHWWGTNAIGQDVYAQTVRGLAEVGDHRLLVAVCLHRGGVRVGTAAVLPRLDRRTLMFVVDLLLVLPSFLIISIVSPRAVPRLDRAGRHDRLFGG